MRSTPQWIGRSAGRTPKQEQAGLTSVARFTSPLWIAGQRLPDGRYSAPTPLCSMQE
jgi:hypothetical protein